MTTLNIRRGPEFSRISGLGVARGENAVPNEDIIEPMREWTRPGQYNDPDMLMVGVRNTLSPTENRAHMSMWAMLSAPLIAGNDIRNMSADVRSILTHRDVLAIDQDPLVRQADRVRDDGDAEFLPLDALGPSMQIIFDTITATASR